ncbi:MAG: hypothetical protein KGL74_02235 [Elusimicrobia bacterium]|nr:hypothetical protein [Elusimicrobiota bacterium]
MTGLGIASIVAGVLAVLLMVSGFLLKLLPPGSRLQTQFVTQLLGLGIIGGSDVACLGIGLAIGALVFKGGGKVPAIAGALFNVLILTSVSSLALLGLFVGSRTLAARKTQAAALAAGAQATAQAAADARASLLKAASIGMEQAQHEGYTAVTVADLIADPDHHLSTRVCFTGFYSGTSPDLFFVWGRFGKGGTVRVDGSGLGVDKKKDLLNRLDGFHRVLIKGNFGGVKPAREPRLGLPRAPQTSVRADEVVDLGRDPNPSAEDPAPP